MFSLSASPLVLSVLPSELLLLNPLTGEEKIHFLLLLYDYSDKRWFEMNVSKRGWPYLWVSLPVFPLIALEKSRPSKVLPPCTHFSGSDSTFP